MRTQYENDPVVRTIRRLLDGNGGKWEGTAGQLLKTGADLGFGRIAPTAQKLGYHLRELEAQMGMYDNVVHTSAPYGTSGRKHCFQCKNNEWTEMAEDIVLPF